MLLEDDIHEPYKALKAILKDNLLLEKDNILSKNLDPKRYYTFFTVQK